MGTELRDVAAMASFSSNKSPKTTDPLSDEIIVTIAEEVTRNSYTRLGVKLGFGYNKLDNILSKHSQDTETAATELLMAWKTEHGSGPEQAATLRDTLQFARLWDLAKHIPTSSYRGTAVAQGGLSPGHFIRVPLRQGMKSNHPMNSGDQHSKKYKVPTYVGAQGFDLREMTADDGSTFRYENGGATLENFQPPEAPGKPEVIKKFHDSVMVKVSAPRVGSAHVQAYLVKYRETSHPDLEWSEYKSHTTIASIPDLRPNTTYELSVAAIYEDMGSQCSALSEVGIIKTLSTSQTGKPKVLKNTHESLALNWDAPLIGISCVRAYIVKYRELTSKCSEWSEYRTLNANPNATIIDLKHNTMYEFMVAAICENGDSHLSTMSDVRIGQTLSSSPPGKPDIMKTSYKSTQLQWGAPQVGSECVQRYIVKYRESMSNQYFECCEYSATNGTMTTTIPNLRPNSTYEFVVEALCNNDNSDLNAMSDTSTVKTLPSSPPGKPAVHEATHNCLKLKWDAPKVGSEWVQGYLVKCKETQSEQNRNQSKWSEYKTSRTTIFATISHLQPSTEYEVSVAAMCKMGDLTFSVIGEVSNAETLSSSSPGKPEIIKTSHESLQLKWASPLVGRECVVRYHVKHRIASTVRECEWSEYMAATNTANNVTIHELNPNTAYDCVVEATCSKGDVTYIVKSDICMARTLSTSPPGKPEILSIYHNAVKLKWTAPRVGSPSVLNYLVKYREITSVNVPEWSEFKTSNKAANATIGSLRNDKTYEFSVASICEHGDSERSEISELAKTLSSSPPGKPIILKTYHDSTQLQWDVPHVGGENVQVYLVKYRRTTSRPDSEWSECMSGSNNVTISNLVPNTTYDFCVAAICETGDSELSERSDVKIAKTLSSSPPGKPEILKTSHDSVILTWTAPNVGCERVQEYRVKFQEKALDKNHSWAEHSTSSTMTNATIPSLTPDTTYGFAVAAICENADTEFNAVSDVNTAKTLLSCPPGKPQIVKIFHDSVILNWNAPQIGLARVQAYLVKYREALTQDSDWYEWRTPETLTSATISNLKPNTAYEFSVAAISEHEYSCYSQISNVSKTLPSSPPRDVIMTQVSTTSITIGWDRPRMIGFGLNILRYGVKCVPVGDNNPDHVVMNETIEAVSQCYIENLNRCASYSISVSAKFGTEVDSDFSDPVEVTTDSRRLDELISQCKVLREGNFSKGEPSIYKVPLTKRSKGAGHNYQRYDVGDKMNPGSKHVVIMLVGATGSGKSTLIDAIINYMFQVKWEDDVRFTITADEEENIEWGQAHSQKEIVTLYTIYPTKWSILDYTLTILDTPGFGDTRGIYRDKAIVDQISDFLSDYSTHPIDHIDAIGFVAQASQTRLTHCQKFMFDSVVSMFGKDIEDSTTMMVTFADGIKPPVIDAIQAARIPCLGKGVFKFNNSALFVSHSCNACDACDFCFEQMFWRMGEQSMRRFFDSLNKIEKRSLSLTREVLKERKRLNATVDAIQQHIKLGCDSLNVLQTEQLINDANGSIQRLEKIALRPNPLSTLDYVDLLIESEKQVARLGWQDRVMALSEVRTYAEILRKINEVDYNPFEQSLWKGN